MQWGRWCVDRDCFGGVDLAAGGVAGGAVGYAWCAAGIVLMRVEVWEGDLRGDSFDVGSVDCRGLVGSCVWRGD